MEAIILAGGFGTRLSHVVKDVPKPMADIAGKPFLEYLLDDLVSQGITKIILAVHYKKEYIMNYFGHSFKNAEIEYSVEDSPLLTGGAVKKACELSAESSIWVINGDTYFQVDLREMKKRSERMQLPVTMAVKKMSHFSRYGSIEIDEFSRVASFCEKEPCEEGYINGGIYLINKNILEEYPKKFSLEKDCFPRIQAKGGIATYLSDGYFIDIGVPEDYYQAQHYFQVQKNGED